jgi:hypothetical protein
MSSFPHVLALVQAYAALDEPRFMAAAALAAEQEAQQGNPQGAQQLRAALAAARALARSGTPGARGPGLLEEALVGTRPACTLAGMVLEPGLRQRLQCVLAQQRGRARLAALGLRSCSKLFVFGPRGVGKALSAAALAGELGLPLCSVRLDHLAQECAATLPAKLRRLLEAARSRLGVYFLERVEALAGEARDVLLRQLEQDFTGSLVMLSAGRLPPPGDELLELLDEALEYPLPAAPEALELLRRRLRGLGGGLPLELPAQAQGLSHAQLCRASDAVLKEALLCEQSQTCSQGLTELLTMALTREKCLGDSGSSPGGAKPKLAATKLRTSRFLARMSLGG